MIWVFIFIMVILLAVPGCNPNSPEGTVRAFAHAVCYGDFDRAKIYLLDKSYKRFDWDEFKTLSKSDYRKSKFWINPKYYINIFIKIIFKIIERKSFV